MMCHLVRVHKLYEIVNKKIACDLWCGKEIHETKVKIIFLAWEENPLIDLVSTIMATMENMHVTWLR